MWLWNDGSMRAPIAAMDEHRERRALACRRQEQIDELPLRVAIAKAELGLAALEHVGAIIFGRARPAGKNLRVVGHA